MLMATAGAQLQKHSACGKLQATRGVHPSTCKGVVTMYSICGVYTFRLHAEVMSVSDCNTCS